MAKRMKRAYLKKHRSTGVPKGSLHDYHMRAKSAESDFSRTFSICQDPKFHNDPWIEVQNTIQRMKEAIPTERSILLGSGRIFTTRLFFNEDSTIWFFMRLNKVTQTVEKSMTFGSKDIAMERWINGTVRWLYDVSLAQFPASPE